MPTKTQDIATIDTYEAMSVAPHDIADMLLAAGGGQRISPFDLDVVKIPSGQGAAFWTVQTLDGEMTTPALEGIVIMQRTIRSYWSKGMEESGGGSPPDCSSHDGVTGIGLPAGHPDLDIDTMEVRFSQSGEEIRRGRFDCARCPLAEFGSDARGRGQACKQNLLLFLLTPESVIPTVIKVPPSSIKPVRNFIMRIGGRGVPPHGAVMSFGLNKVKNSGGIAYFEIVPSLVRRLDPEEATKMKALRESLLPVLAGVKIEAD